MLDDPARVDAHVVGHHVAGQPDAVLPGPVAQRSRRRPRHRGRRRSGSRRGRRRLATASALPRMRLIRSEATRALPQPDEPQAGHAPAREPRQLLVGDRIERPDLASVAARQLVEPDVRALGHQHELGHPGRVAREGLRLVRGPRRRPAAPPRAGGDPRRRHRSAGAAPRSSSSRMPMARSRRPIRASSSAPRIAAQCSRT